MVCTHSFLGATRYAIAWIIRCNTGSHLCSLQPIAFVIFVQSAVCCPLCIGVNALLYRLGIPCIVCRLYFYIRTVFVVKCPTMYNARCILWWSSFSEYTLVLMVPEKKKQSSFAIVLSCRPLLWTPVPMSALWQSYRHTLRKTLNWQLSGQNGWLQSLRSQFILALLLYQCDSTLSWLRRLLFCTGIAKMPLHCVSLRNSDGLHYCGFTWQVDS